MSVRIVFLLVLGLSTLCGASPAPAVSALDALSNEQMDRMQQLADIARAGSDSRITASRVDSSKRNESVTNPTPPVLVSIEGEPAFIYTRGKDYGVPEGKLESVVRCRGNGMVDLSLTLRAVPPANINTGKLMPLEMYMKPGEEYSLVFNGKIIPVQWAETIPNYALLVRVVTSLPANGPFFNSLRGNTGFGYYMKRPVKVIGNNEIKILQGGVKFISFRKDLGPLLEHCRAGKPNPMDREMGPSTAIVDSAKPATPPEVDLDFLPAFDRSDFRRILRGESMSTEASLRVPLLTYFAYHLAFWERCKSAPGTPMNYYTTTPLPQVRPIGIHEDDYASFVVAATAYDPISRAIYDNEFMNDFSFSTVNERYNELIPEKKELWHKVISHYGCTGEVQAAFRKAVRNDLPYLDYKEGSRNVIVEYERSTFNVVLPHPLNLEMSRQIGAAEMASVNDTVFNDSYPGLVLRSIAIGNFAQVGRIEADMTELASNPFNGNPDNLMSRFLSSAMTFDAAMRRQSNIITAYAIARMNILGDCGDDTLAYQQNQIYWTEYTNGLGQYRGSSAPTYRTDYAEVPQKFDAIVKRQNSITTPELLSREVGAVVSKLSCTSRIRTQLEDNMIAYFNGSAPVHIAPITVSEK